MGTLKQDNHRKLHDNRHEYAYTAKLLCRCEDKLWNAINNTP